MHTFLVFYSVLEQANFLDQLEEKSALKIQMDFKACVFHYWRAAQVCAPTLVEHDAWVP